MVTFAPASADKRTGLPDLDCDFIAPVAQLDRVLGFEPRGWGFESLRAHNVLLLCAREEARTGDGSEERKFLRVGVRQLAKLRTERFSKSGAM